MFKFNGTEVAHVFFDGLDIDIVNINGVKVFEAVRKREYDPILMTRTVTPYGETVSMDITDIQEGGHIDTANIVTSGSIPISNLSMSGNRLSFKTASCNKGITGKIQVPVVECKDYFDYLIPIDLDSCTHPSSKLTHHSGSAATCTGSGTSEYYTCSCDTAKHTLNASGNEISTYIAPLGHSFTSTTIYSKTRQLRSSATCVAYATYYRECIRCTVNTGTYYGSSTSLYITDSASGYGPHNFSSDPRRCSVCGYIPTPYITRQPSSLTVGIGVQVTISLTAQGNGLSYQWYLKRANSSSWTTSGADGSRTNAITFVTYGDHNGNQYYCKITDQRGVSITSNTVTMHVS